MLPLQIHWGKNIEVSDYLNLRIENIFGYHFYNLICFLMRFKAIYGLF